MNLWDHIKRPPWRTLLLLLAILGTIALSYVFWSPGKRVLDGRHDLRTNGMWLQHGWIGDDGWFERNERDKTLFRDDVKIAELADLLSQHGIKYIFPHLCPCDLRGPIAPVDPVQTERFLDHMEGVEVIPWIGGVLDVHCSPDSPKWRAAFVASVVELLKSHPRLAGVQLNIEPLPTGNEDFLVLLDELREAMPEGKIISVAAYPPPTVWHKYPKVHWEEEYFKEVAKRVDQMAPMMYDSAIKVPKLYRHLMAEWTSEVLEWSGSTEVLLGIPAYDDAGVGYHDPKVENLENSLQGIHAALSDLDELPGHYAGVAIYCEWEIDEEEWSIFKEEFEK